MGQIKIFITGIYTFVAWHIALQGKKVPAFLLLLFPYQGNLLDKRGNYSENKISIACQRCGFSSNEFALFRCIIWKRLYLSPCHDKIKRE